MSKGDELKPQVKKPDGQFAMNYLIADSSKELFENRDVTRHIITEIQELARTTRTKGDRSDQQNTSLERFKTAAVRMIPDFGTKKGDILSVIPAYRTAVIDMVSRALHSHFIGFMRSYEKGPHGIFNPPPEGMPEEPATFEARRQYVQEFTSVVSEIYMLMQPQATHMSEAQKRQNAALLAQYYSPDVVASLFSGSLVRETLDQNHISLDDEKIADMFTPGTLLRIAAGYTKDIRGAVARFARAYAHLAEDSPTDGPVSLLSIINEGKSGNDQWTAEDVRHVFSPATLRDLIIHTGGLNPENRIRNVANAYRLMLDTSNLLKVINTNEQNRPWSQQEIETIFLPFIRVEIARNYYGSLEEAIKRFAKGDLKIARYRVTESRNLDAAR